MAIEIINKAREVRSFNVYDFEWIPGSMTIRICSVYDGNECRRYKDVGAFIDGEFTHNNRGKWFYAHAGGLADIQFVIQILKDRPEFVVEATFSGSSAIIVKVRRGHNSWTLVDSYWLLRDRLANIAKWIGMEKTGPKGEDDDDKIKEWYATIPLEQLIPYNENDCRILWHAIHDFERRLLEFGGELMMTLASCAMRLFRRRYLKRDVTTSMAVNEACREAYFASRVEVFERHVTDAEYYDINSSFPFAMTFPSPGECIGVGNRLPEGEDVPYVARMLVEVPEQYLTTTPVRMKERVFFPTGKFWARLCDVDVRSLLESGGKIHKVGEVFIFDQFHDLGDYARDLYTRRLNAKDPMEKVVYKLLLNSLYGKFAESDEKHKVWINPGLEVLQRLSKENQYMPGVFFEDVKVKIQHMHVPFSMSITARARKTLDSYLQTAGEGRFYYCDTDGFATKHKFPTGDELGQLKLERTIGKAEYILPKLYRMDDKVKAKGFSLGWDEKNEKKKARAIKRFEDLVDGKEIEVERMIRLRENMRNHILDPREKIIRKKLAKKFVPKRFTFPDGKTRPWQVEELQKKLHIRAS